MHLLLILDHHITVKYDLIACLWKHEVDCNTVWKFQFQSKFCIFLFCLGNAIEVVYRCGTLVKVKVKINPDDLCMHSYKIR